MINSGPQTRVLTGTTLESSVSDHVSSVNPCQTTYETEDSTPRPRHTGTPDRVRGLRPSSSTTCLNRKGRVQYSERNLQERPQVHTIPKVHWTGKVTFSDRNRRFLYL